MISDRVELEPSGPRDGEVKAGLPPVSRAGGGHWWVWLLIVLALAVAAYFLVPKLIHPQSAASAGAGAAAANRPVPVVVDTARKDTINIFLSELGTVAAFNTVSVHSRVDGQIIKVHYTEGQMVKAGDPLVDIDPRPYQAQLEEAQGQLVRDQALLANAKKDLERYRSVQSSTEQQVATQQALISQYTGAITTDQGQIKNASVQVEYCHITSPLNGRIGLRLVDEGNIVHATDTTALAVITQLQPIAVLFTVPEDDISRIMKRPDHGQGLLVEAYDHNQTTHIASGSLLAIDNQVDLTTLMVHIKAQFENKDNALFPNQAVVAKLLVDTLHDVVIVPKEAVQVGPEPGSSFVYVVQKAAGSSADKSATVKLVNVVAGATEGDDTVITQGVAAGDIVVTDGVDKLQEGSKVTTHPRAATTQPSTQPSTRPARGSRRGRP